MKMNYHHFVTGAFNRHAASLSAEEYAKVLDSVVVATADIAVINNRGEILLGKRTRAPWPDWWIIGGRMMPGESFEEAASRKLKEELSLDIEVSRLSYIGTYSLVWGERAQEPIENGSHTVSITMTATITDKEMAALKPNDEYAALQWVSPEHVSHSDFHSAIRQGAKDIIAFIKNK
ncbi:MAG: NUDIX domain-containing protein [Parcubacteria group bacterium]|nr:NUDIX domain-containing protein [Parcubacteria group bacterium]